MNPSRRNGLVSATGVANLRRSTQESDADEDEESDLPKSGSWKPQVHFVWDMLLDQVLPKPGVQGERAPKGTFPEFFRIVVDGLSRPPAAHASARLMLDAASHRIAVRFDGFARAEVLGLPGVPKGAAACQRRRHADAVHEELHAVVDQPPLQ